MLAEDVHASLRAHHDFPVKGIVFQDIAPLLRDPALFARVVAAMSAPFAARVDAVAGVESRGFIFGAPIAMRLGVPFIPIRKKGKLPGATLHEDYQLEYGPASVEMQLDALRPGARVVIVDDVLATAGTAKAAQRLVEKGGGDVVGFSFLLEIAALGGRARLPKEAHVVVSV